MLVNSNYRYGGGGIGSSLIIEGYYNNSKFYQDDSFTIEIDGESGKLYVDLSTNKTYRWTGSIFTAFNADTLDGLHASDFCNANSPRITGAIRVNPNTEGNFSEGIRIANATNGYSDIVLGAEGDAGITSTGIYIGKTAANEFVIARGASGDSSNGSLRLDTSGNWNVNGSNQLIHSGNIGSQSVANAVTASQVVGSSSKVRLWEDNEGGNLRLVAPDGVHSMEMDLYNNEGFRMYFGDGTQLYFPVDYNFSTGKFNINGNATTATTATKLSTSAGSATQPVYFSSGKPVACTYTLGKSVPSNAVFTDTTYSVATSSENGLMSSSDKAKLDGIATGANKITVDSALSSTSTNPVQNNVINSALAGKAASSHTHTKSQITDFPSSLPADGGNADTVDGLHAYNMATLNSSGYSHGESLPMYCRFNVLGDQRFYIGVSGNNGVYERSVAVGFAELASSSVSADKVSSTLIGSTDASFTTILEWANANSGLAHASIVAGNGIPSDAPTQDEAVLRLESDRFGVRKIVTWTKFGGTPVIYQRAIFNGSWLDAGWERVK